MLLCENNHSILFNLFIKKCLDLSCKLEIFNEILLAPVELIDGLKWNKKKRTGAFTITVVKDAKQS